MATPLAKMLTANCLTKGDVLYWKGHGWTYRLAEGEVFADATAADAAVLAAQKFVTANKIVSPYLFEVRVEQGHIRPVKEREIVRAAGPSVRPDLGKQAETGSEISNV